MAASATRLVELSMVPELAKEVAAQIDAAISPGEIVNADISASAAIALSKLATGALPSAITVASANIVADTIVNADIAPAAAIALSKLETAALPTGITVASANLVDGTIVNADVNASAAIATTKLAATADIAALTASRAAPAVYAETGAGLAAVLVALGVMAAA